MNILTILGTGHKGNTRAIVDLFLEEFKGEDVNFDELVSSTFGDAVSIGYNKDYSADVLRNKQKYTLNLGNKSARTWKDDKKDIDETGEIGSIIQLYVESLNVWKGDNTTPQKITFGDIKTSFGEMMNLLSIQINMMNQLSGFGKTVLNI